MFSFGYIMINICAFKPTQKAFIFTNMNDVQHKRNIHLET